MKQSKGSWLHASVVSLGLSFVLLGWFATPDVSRADGDTGPYCNVGGDPTMPKGCYGWCYSPKVCRIHPVQLVCDCR